MKVRNVSFDYAKGIGIIIVVFAHLLRGIEGAGLLGGMPRDVFLSISSSCTVWSMPAFFFISGILYGRGLDKRHGAKELAGKFDGIFYPYLIWSVITGLIEVASSGYRNGTSDLNSIYKVIWEPRGIFWFLYALFEAFLITEILIKFIGPAKSRLALLPISLAMLSTWGFGPLPMAISELQMSLVYFAIGLAISTKISMEQRPSVWIGIVSILGVFGVLYASTMLFSIRTTSFRSVTPNATAIALVVLAFFMVFCYSLPRTGLDWLQALGEKSMDIYLIHLLLIAPVRIFMQKALGLSDPLLFIIIGLPAGVFGSLFIAGILRRINMGWLFSPPKQVSLKSRLN